MKNKAELFYSNPAEMEVRSRYLYIDNFVTTLLYFITTRQTKSKEELIKMSSNVTGNLRNICQSMASVLEQNRNTLEVLGNQSAE